MITPNPDVEKASSSGSIAVLKFLTVCVASWNPTYKKEILYIYTQTYVFILHLWLHKNTFIQYSPILFRLGEPLREGISPAAVNE